MIIKITESGIKLRITQPISFTPPAVALPSGILQMPTANTVYEKVLTKTYSSPSDYLLFYRAYINNKPDSEVLLSLVEKLNDRVRFSSPVDDTVVEFIYTDVTLS